MADVESLTISLPSELAVLVKGAVEEGSYSSSSELIGEALRDWRMKRELHSQKFAALKADIDLGMANIAAGRVTEFNPDRIIERGRELSAERDSSV